MPAFVTINDDRWQFIAGNKYFVIGTIRMTGNYVAGGIPLSFKDTRNPIPVGASLIKASRAPFFADITPDAAGNQYNYLTPSEILGIDPPNTVGTAGRPMGQPVTDINDGKLVIRNAAGTEITGALPSGAATTGLFIFQGME